ncbi:MAG: hypothetical protein Tsb009_38630 [Planctomycetaceae bacterium]
MPRVFIPPLLRSLTGGVDIVEVDAGNVREVIEELENRFPGTRERLCVDGDLKPGLTVAVNETVSSRGMIEKTPPDCEVHFLPAIGGG